VSGVMDRVPRHVVEGSRLEQGCALTPLRQMGEGNVWGVVSLSKNAIQTPAKDL